LREDANKSYTVLIKLVQGLGISEESANTIIKLSYDIIMNLIRAKMIMEGYNSSGQGAHEAEVSYLRELKFRENDVQFCNQLRFFRNGIMYYGKNFDPEYAKQVIDFLKKTFSQLK